MQEDIEQRSIAISIEAGKLTAKVLRSAIATTLAKIQSGQIQPKVGRNSMARLAGVDGGSNNIEIMGRIRSFERYARKYQVRYHVEREIGSDPPKWTVFFKANQEDALMNAFKEYTKKTVDRDTRDKKPSIIEQLRKFKEQVKAASNERVRHKQHEEPER